MVVPLLVSSVPLIHGIGHRVRRSRKHSTLRVCRARQYKTALAGLGFDLRSSSSSLHFELGVLDHKRPNIIT